MDCVLELTFKIVKVVTIFMLSSRVEGIVTFCGFLYFKNTADYKIIVHMVQPLSSDEIFRKFPVGLF